MYARAIGNPQGSSFLVRDGSVPQDPLQLALVRELRQGILNQGRIRACTPRYGSDKVISNDGITLDGGKEV